MAKSKSLLVWPILAGIGIGGGVLYLFATNRGRNHFQRGGNMIAPSRSGVSSGKGSSGSSTYSSMNGAAAAAAVSNGR